jgi:pyruvate formate lyase activating enzyme
MQDREMTTGTIFDIKRFAVHDGPGVRTTVFFKGCPLHCLWCHNPEGIAAGLDLLVRSSRCARCYSCIPACPRKAISKGPKNGPIVVDRAKCDLCGKCAEACMYEALVMAGRKVTVADVVAEVERDRIFYEQSGGGVTLSGGEPLAQPSFCRELLTELKARGFHTALDTSGLASWETLASCAEKSDLVLYDLKLIDDRKHRETTGVSNAPILANLKKLAGRKKAVAVRIPLMAGVNDGPSDVRAVIEFLKPFPSVKTVALLRYHKGGQEKYRNLGQEPCFKIYDPPSDERVGEIRRAFADAGFHVRIGG